MPFEPYTEITINSDGKKITTPEEKKAPEQGPPGPQEVITGGGRAIKVPGQPAAGPKKAREEEHSTPDTSPAPNVREVHLPRREAKRDFIIAYRGVFIGHYRSSRCTTDRTAFEKIARMLQSSLKNFDIGKLEIYEPVPLNVERPDSIEDIAEGSFHWFSPDGASPSR